MEFPLVSENLPSLFVLEGEPFSKSIHYHIFVYQGFLHTLTLRETKIFGFVFVNILEIDREPHNLHVAFRCLCLVGNIVLQFCWKNTKALVHIFSFK